MILEAVNPTTISGELAIISKKIRRLAPTIEVIDRNEVERLRGVAGLVVGEIAGRDSVAAIVKAVDEGVTDVLPTVVYTGTEYGDWIQLDENIDALEVGLAERSARLHRTVILGDPGLWSAICGRYSGILSERYGSCGICTGCHLYLHLCRTPLALAVGALRIVSGERESHQESVKLNQTAAALDAYIEIIAAAGLELSMPIRHVSSNDEIEALAGGEWREGERQLGCVMSGNYRDTGGRLFCDPEKYERYLREFLVPAGKRLLSIILADGEDYASVVGGLIESIVRAES